MLLKLCCFRGWGTKVQILQAQLVLVLVPVHGVPPLLPTRPAMTAVPAADPPIPDRHRFLPLPRITPTANMTCQ
ncbi:hypothetical protein CBS147343_3606 [Aspergillus niger]|nr:hypothetical protein CBS147371_3713 [Aspergillus niger]KAI2927519.1 hypothetical protein CBS147320_5109 [Aspergillus niger]KAI3014229.1 hypothetical protein CBS147482_3824 [Aspergillus niger]KAI3079272.1 hypothetical protein CBS147343_3606 [Aspergillus niger]